MLIQSSPMAMRLGSTVLLIALAWVTAATSCVWDLMLINRSADSVEVILTAERGTPLDPACHCADGFIPKLAVAPASKFAKGRTGPWVPLDSPHVTTSLDQGTGELRIALTLPTHSALLVGRVVNAGGWSLHPSFAALELTTPSKSERWLRADVSRVFRGPGYAYEFHSSTECRRLYALARNAIDTSRVDVLLIPEYAGTTMNPFRCGVLRGEEVRRGTT